MMIIDADTHYAPYKLAKNFPDKDYQKWFLDYNQPGDRQSRWHEYYNVIKGPDWPESGPYQDFHVLPLWIRQEIFQFQRPSWLFVAQDLDYVTIDGFDDESPEFEDFQRGLRDIVQVDKALLNPQAATMMMQYNTESTLAVDLMRAWNRHAMEICRASDFFDATAWLALQDLDASMQELEYIRDNDFFGVYFGDHIPWGYLDSFFPVFHYCEKFGIPIYLHMSAFEHVPLRWHWDTDDCRYQSLRSKWSQRRDNWWITIASFIVNGWLDKLPDLKIVVAERDCHWAVELRKFMLDQDWPDPLSYFQRNFWSTFECENDFSRVGDLIGWHKLMFSSDYPHNDEGGRNRFNDVAMLDSMLQQEIITMENYHKITSRNYLDVKTRNKISP